MATPDESAAIQNSFLSPNQREWEKERCIDIYEKHIASGIGEKEKK